MASSEKEPEYLHFNHSCFMRNNAYKTHKVFRDKYYYKEKLCENKKCLQTCELDVEDPKVLYDHLCYYDTSSYCGQPFERPKDGKLNRPSEALEIREYCLCTGPYKKLYYDEPIECICYQKDWDYCYKRRDNDRNEECNLMRKTCNFTSYPKYRRMDTICEITDFIAIHNEEIAFNHSFFSESEKLDLIVYDLPTVLKMVTPKKISSESNTKKPVDEYSFDFSYDNVHVHSAFSSSNNLNPHLFYNSLLFIFFLIIYSRLFSKVRFNIK